MMKQVHLKMPLRMLAALFGLILSASALGQEITVKGHVVDATGDGDRLRRKLYVTGESGRPTDRLVCGLQGCYGSRCSHGHHPHGG